MALFIDNPHKVALTNSTPAIIGYEAGGALGDAAIECRDIEHIRKAFPNAQVIVSLYPIRLNPIFMDSGVTEFLYPHYNDPTADEYRYFLQQFEAANCDLVFHSFRCAYDAREYSRFDGVSLPARPLFNEGGGYYWKKDEKPHVLDAREAFLEELFGVPAPSRDKIRLPKVELSGELKIVVEEFISQSKSPDKIAIISISSSVPPQSPRKRYGFPKTCSMEKWIHVANELTGLGYGVILTGGIKNQNTYTKNITPGVLNLVEELDLHELRGVFSSANVVIGGDSGPGHLASMMGIPTVSVFPKAGHPEYWSPGYARNISLKSPLAHPDHVDTRDVIEAVEMILLNPR